MVLEEQERLPAWSPMRQWARTAWVSKVAQNKWAPRISRINQVLEILELESVFRDQRHSALVFKAPDDLILLTKIAVKHGCVVIPLATESASKSNYSASGSPVVPGQPIRFRTIVTKDPKPWAPDPVTDELEIGRLLGYPKCCSEFYKRVWCDESWKDTTYEMVKNGGVEGPPECNILLRWLGLRFVRHLPCSFSCKATEANGVETTELAKTLGFNEEMDWLREMLSWNIQWSSLHGIAIVTTPVFKFTTNTDPFRKVVVVQKIGTVTPEEGATGLSFPFALPDKLKVTESKSFLTAISSPREWTDNGFGSEAVMLRSHGQLSDLFSAQFEMEQPKSILDLGCGNGRLLQSIAGKWFPSAQLHGVEFLEDRATRAKKKLPNAVITCGNIKHLSNWDERYDLIIFMPGRLQEMSPQEAIGVESQLRKSSLVLLYAYGDRLETSPFGILRDSHSVISTTSTDGIRADLLKKN